MSNGPILSAANRNRCNGCTFLHTIATEPPELRCYDPRIRLAEGDGRSRYIGTTDATPDWCPFLRHSEGTVS